MAYTTDFNTLSLDLQAYVEDNSSEFISAIPSIIARGQDRVQIGLDLDVWRTTQPATLTSGIRLQSRPTTIKLRSIFLASQTGVAIGDYIKERTYDFCRAYLGTGIPVYWAELSDTQIYIAPTPSLAYTVEFETQPKLVAITAMTPTNWITLNAADLLLLGCLVESEKFLKGSDRTAEFRADFDNLLLQYKNFLRGDARPAYTPTRPSATIGGDA